jgi:hypothetical protein
MSIQVNCFPLKRDLAPRWIFLTLFFKLQHVSWRRFVICSVKTCEKLSVFCLYPLSNNFLIKVSNILKLDWSSWPHSEAVSFKSLPSTKRVVGTSQVDRSYMQKLSIISELTKIEKSLSCFCSVNTFIFSKYAEAIFLMEFNNTNTETARSTEFVSSLCHLSYCSVFSSSGRVI